LPLSIPGTRFFATFFFAPTLDFVATSRVWPSPLLSPWIRDRVGLLGDGFCANIKMEHAAAMTIEIRRPELEALIMERMKTGRFHSVEDALMQALVTSPAPREKPATPAKNRTSADLIAAMQESPYRELEIEPARYPMPVRNVTF
jgi:hypothetical protein